MRVMAQMAMVMNLDKCIGCHTCSVTCKQAWTNRAGTEYVWFNNVETRPGLGYPRTYEDQEKWKGGWTLNRRGRLTLKGGGRLRKLLTIFANPKLPSIQEYYEPWTYNYATLTDAPAQEHTPVARPKSLISGENMKVTWSANWDDDLGGSTATARLDPMLKNIADKVKFEFEQTFMFYLPRICEHCLNPSCAASCPSGAIYKRSEDGIVLVDQDQCRGWRMCVSGCPYKKIYFNHRTGKAEKCTFCFPRVEVGLPTVCSETCVGRLRYIGLMLYDADKVLEAASVPDEHDLYEAQRSVFLDPDDPEVVREAEKAGIARDWIEAAQRSPIHALINRYKVALPLHPEYRTMPMVWYIPPLSPVVDVVKDTGYDAEDTGNLFAAIDALRIPVEYLAELFTAGDVAPVDPGAQEARGDALLHARHQHGSRAERRHPRVGRDERGGHVRHVPPAGDREVRRAIRDPAGARRAGPLAGGARHRVLAGLRGRAGHGGLRTVRGGLGHADADRGRELPDAAEPADDGHDGRGDDGRAGRDGATGEPAQLGRPGHPPGALPTCRACRCRRRGAGMTPQHLAPQLSPEQLTIAWQSASLLVSYPDEQLMSQLDLLGEAARTLPDEVGGPLTRTIGHLRATGLNELAEDYVATFDNRRRCCLFLTYFAHGDTRKRGVALLEFKQAYARAGLRLTEEELPDHLAVLLEFGATTDPASAWSLLLDHRAGLELLRMALRDSASGWTGAVEAVTATLPALRGDERDAVRRLAEQGPPDEEVGLAPFAPPEYMPAARGGRHE